MTIIKSCDPFVRSNQLVPFNTLNTRYERRIKVRGRVDNKGAEDSLPTFVTLPYKQNRLKSLSVLTLSGCSPYTIMTEPCVLEGGVWPRVGT